MGSAATACDAGPDAAGTSALFGAARLGATIGAPMVAFGIPAPVTGVAVTGGGGVVEGTGRATAGGATARSPASVSAIGDIGADSQSSPSNTLPSAIAATAL